MTVLWLAHLHGKTTEVDPPNLLQLGHRLAQPSQPEHLKLALTAYGLDHLYPDESVLDYDENYCN